MLIDLLLNTFFRIGKYVYHHMSLEFGFILSGLSDIMLGQSILFL